MTPAEFKTARATLGITQEAMAIKLGDPPDRYSLRAVESWESGERKVPPSVAKLVNLMVRAKG